MTLATLATGLTLMVLLGAHLFRKVNRRSGGPAFSTFTDGLDHWND